jgi:hypothetical protein
MIEPDVSKGFHGAKAILKPGGTDGAKEGGIALDHRLE